VHCGSHVHVRMLTATLPDDPAIILKAMICGLQAENAQNLGDIAGSTGQLVQAFRLRIAKLQKLGFGKSSEKIRSARSSSWWNWPLKTLLLAVGEGD